MKPSEAVGRVCGELKEVSQHVLEKLKNYGTEQEYQYVRHYLESALVVMRKSERHLIEIEPPEDFANGSSSMIGDRH
jgi:hypothetical protein